MHAGPKKNASHRSYELFDFVSVPVFAIEPDDHARPVYAALNVTACQISGLSAADVIGCTAKEVYGGRLGQIAYERHCLALRDKLAAVYELTLPINGQQRRIRTQLVPELNEDGDVIRLIGTSEDITASHDVEEMWAKTATLNREMEDFISLSAHDLRSPIRNVNLIADMLREDFQDLGDGKLEMIDLLEKVASQAMALISDVLSHAQATGSTEIIDTFSLQDISRQILIMLDPAGALDALIDNVEIEADRVAVQIVLRNLIDNAIKHNELVGLNLRIEAAQQDSECVEFSVSDNGNGFPSASLDYLQGGKLRTDSGFGLAGIKRLVSARGGQLSVEMPLEGRGAKVKFTLPGKIIENYQPTQFRASIAY